MCLTRRVSRYLRRTSGSSCVISGVLRSDRVTTYAIIDRRDGLIDVVDTSGSKAMEHAASLNRGDVWFDGPEAWLEGRSVALAANKARSHAKMREDPYLALAKTRLPRGVRLEDVLRRYPKRHLEWERAKDGNLRIGDNRTDNNDPGLIAAFEDLQPHFPKTKEMKGVDEGVKQWQTPKGMVEGLLAQNAKMEKKLGEGMPRYLAEQLRGNPPPEAWGLALAPYDMAFNGKLKATAFDDAEARRLAKKFQLGKRGTLCFRKTAECSASCLVYSGQNNVDKYNYVIKFAKSRALLKEPLAFLRVLIDAMGRKDRSQSIWPFARLNVFSDIPWELFFPDIFRLYPDLWCYDYTKIPGRDPEDLIGVRYDLTFSYSGHNKPEMIFELTKMNRRVAVVFATEKHELPRFAWDIPVVDADISDFRPLDPPNPGTGSSKPVVVGLAYKDPLGNMQAKESENIDIFVVPCEEQSDGNVIIHETPGQTPIHALGHYHRRVLRSGGVKRRLYLV